MNSGNSLNLHAILWRSQANGPGTRAVFWCQGCTLGCHGCFNAEAQGQEAGTAYSPAWLVAELSSLRHSIEGITLTGGEPLQQRPAVAEFLREVNDDTGLSVVLFTGYTLEEVRALPQGPEILGCVDVLLAGRYDPNVPKTVHLLTPRYTPADLASVPEAEVILRPNGEMILTGTASLRGRQAWHESYAGSDVMRQ